MEQWAPTLIALFGSFITGYLGVRIGMAKLEVRMDRVEKDIDRIGPRVHDAFNTAMVAKSDVLRLTDRIERIERNEDHR